VWGAGYWRLENSETGMVEAEETNLIMRSYSAVEIRGWEKATLGKTECIWGEGTGLYC